MRSSPTHATTTRADYARTLRRLALTAAVWFGLAAFGGTAAADSHNCPGYGCQNWPDHDPASSEYHYPPPSDRDGGSGGGDDGGSSYNQSGGGWSKPSCNFCHAGLPADGPGLRGRSLYYPRTLLTNTSQFARVHAQAAQRTRDKNRFTPLKPETDVNPTYRPLYRALQRK